MIVLICKCIVLSPKGKVNHTKLQPMNKEGGQRAYTSRVSSRPSGFPMMNAVLGLQPPDLIATSFPALIQHTRILNLLASCLGSHFTANIVCTAQREMLFWLSAYFDKIQIQCKNASVLRCVHSPLLHATHKS